MKKKPICGETDKFAGLLVDLSQKIRKGKITLEEFESFVNRPIAPSEFPVFKVINLGTHKSISEIYWFLVNNCFHVSDQAKDLLYGMELSESAREITLHSATGRELTGKDDPTLQEVNVAVCSKGYHLCPGEVGPQLRSKNLDQLPGELIYVVMEPIIVSKDNLGIFLVGRDGGGFWLDVYDGSNKHKPSGDSIFVFTSDNL